MVENRKELGMKWIVLTGAMAVVLITGLCSAAYAAQEDTKSSEETRVAGTSFFDPFLLTRVMLPPSSASVGASYVATTVRASAANGNGNGNKNGNGNSFPGPPVWVGGRPPLRSPCIPPFGWAWGRNGPN